jgi:hypothetical protein
MHDESFLKGPVVLTQEAASEFLVVPADAVVVESAVPSGLTRLRASGRMPEEV